MSITSPKEFYNLDFRDNKDFFKRKTKTKKKNGIFKIPDWRDGEESRTEKKPRLVFCLFLFFILLHLILPQNVNKDGIPLINSLKNK